MNISLSSPFKKRLSEVKLSALGENSPKLRNTATITSAIIISTIKLVLTKEVRLFYVWQIMPKPQMSKVVPGMPGDRICFNLPLKRVPTCVYNETDKLLLFAIAFLSWREESNANMLTRTISRCLDKQMDVRDLQGASSYQEWEHGAIEAEQLIAMLVFAVLPLEDSPSIGEVVADIKASSCHGNLL
jgi:hypothetical protein